jgi:ABC-2 type transport system ATP-binding protein
MSNVIEISHLSRQFGSKLALNDVSYQAGEGKVYGLVGVNGAGKTTLIKHMLGVLRARSGLVRIFGKDPVRYPVEVLQDIGYLSEERDLPDWMTIHQLMRYTCAYFTRWDQGYADELLDNFGLDRNTRIKDLSKGMRAQVGLVAAVAHRPRLLILDEPSSGLDALVREDILNAIMRTVSGEGRTVVFSSHLLDEVEMMSDHITMIDNGRAILDGDLTEISQAHQRTVVEGPVDLDFGGVPTLALDHDNGLWTMVHDLPAERLQQDIERCGGTVKNSRGATLQEIFLARVGRGATAAEKIAE